MATSIVARLLEIQQELEYLQGLSKPTPDALQRLQALANELQTLQSGPPPPCPPPPPAPLPPPPVFAGTNNFFPLYGAEPQGCGGCGACALCCDPCAPAACGNPLPLSVFQGPNGCAPAYTIQGPPGLQGPPGPTGPTGYGLVLAGACGVNIVEAVVPNSTQDYIGLITSGPLVRTVPNNGILGGACRGTGAVDWQATRTGPAGVASGEYSIIGGGRQNENSGDGAIIAGGQINTITGAYWCNISGGERNIIEGNNPASFQSGDHATIGGGRNNKIYNSWCSVISGGNSNLIDNRLTNRYQTYNTIGGGFNNEIVNAQYSTIGGGYNNRTATGATIGGGISNTASGLYSTIPGGYNLIAQGTGACAVGLYNKFDTPISSGLVPGNYLFMVGNGTGTSAAERSNAFSVLTNGNCYAQGAFAGGGADYAEWFEGDPDLPIGASVVIQEGRVVQAQAGDEPVGVVRSPRAEVSVVGNAYEHYWRGKYAVDEDGGRVLDDQGFPVISEAYNSDLPYVPRSQRPEWKLVGLLGQVLLRPGQPVGTLWVRLRTYNQKYDLWLVR